jgi:tetratricopeptide (TPR) repeat protein
MTMSRLLLALVLVALAGRAASADDPALRTAKRHFARGEKLYALAKFREALDAYQQAFDARPIPELMFNIGQCYRNLDDPDAAIFSYRTYLKLAPTATNREQVEDLIATLEADKQRATSRRLALERAEPPPPAPAPDRPVYRRWWFWTGLAAVGAGGVAIFAVARSGGPPETSLGNIVFGR